AIFTAPLPKLALGWAASHGALSRFALLQDATRKGSLYIGEAIPFGRILGPLSRPHHPHSRRHGRVGHEFRGYQGGAGSSAAALLRHLALLLRGLPADLRSETACRAVVASGGLWGADRGGAVRASVHRDEVRDFAGPRL